MLDSLENLYNTLKRTNRFLNQKASIQVLKSEKINFFLKKLIIINRIHA